MHFAEGIVIALEALWSNKLRTFLTLLGNIVGVMSVIAVVSIIDGMNTFIRTEVANEGSGVFRVQQVNELDILSDFDKFLKSLHNPDVTLRDLEILRERVTLADYMDAGQSASMEVRYLRHSIKSVGIQGRRAVISLPRRWNAARMSL
jgi:putative ABC transport system permease protein